MKRRLLLLFVPILLVGCQTFGAPKPVSQAVTLEDKAPVTEVILGGGLVGGTLGGNLNAKDRQTALNAEYKSLEYGKAGTSVDWVSQDGTISGQVKSAQPYRVGSQDCRQYSHEIVTNGAPKATRGTACRNNDGSWNLLQ